MMDSERIHRFGREVSADELPPRFTYPFCYEPHALCVEAAAQVRDYLQGRADWTDELAAGKMFGVLVVETHGGGVGFLSAFSGCLAGSNNHDYFVPAVYDLLQPDGEFRRGEAAITALTGQIDLLEKASELALLRREVDGLKTQKRAELDAFRQQVLNEKAERDRLRQHGDVDERLQAEMTARSQYMKAELKRRRARAERELLADARYAELMRREADITALKTSRRLRSERLQDRLFRLFVVSNALGQRSTLADIFRSTPHRVPPGGAGECAAPKLLQYAYDNGLRPRAMGEFWVGGSPRRQVRRDGAFYPACRGKCLPILSFMLQGLELDPNPLRSNTEAVATEIYDDQWLTVVDKPAGLLTVPGKEQDISLLDWYRKRHPEADGPIIVHRLDMDTSGLVLLAKTKEVHKALQAQFERREVHKTYEALLVGTLERDCGTVTLPLRADYLDRPRQVVDFEQGAEAVTRYRVLGHDEGLTRVELQPLTGRTHQLRVHAAHISGLGAMIKGDRLYGLGGDRLCLHARRIEFVHPVTGKKLVLESPMPF